MEFVCLFVCLYRCETWPLNLRVEHKLQVFGSKVPGKIFGAIKDSTYRRTS
jgi:hypothetical protein